MRLPFTSANGNITVHNVVHATIFGFQVWLTPDRTATVIDPPDPANPETTPTRFPLLDTYQGLVNFAKLDPGLTLVVSVGPRHLAQVVAGRHIPFDRLADEFIRYNESTSTWEFVVPATPTNPELIIIVHPGWGDITETGRPQ